MSESTLKPFLVRLTPDSVALLDDASQKQKKTKAAIINNAIKEHLSNDNLTSRLNKVIGE
jgi:predicted DNA-binding protein